MATTTDPVLSDSPTPLSIPAPHTSSDLGRFASSAAIYFMDGYSDVRFKIQASGEELFLSFWDRNTSIAASTPFIYTGADESAFVPVPAPLRTIARYPKKTPDRYTRPTSSHLMQVISMNMKSKESPSRLLIGLPYAEKYPDLFFREGIFEGVNDASSFGAVQSLTTFKSSTGDEIYRNGYPARSFFAIFHILETPVGTFFNKKATQMELQPNPIDGKLALTLPPIPFHYALINSPIPLFDVNDPSGGPIGELVAAHHNSAAPSSTETEDSWPWHLPVVVNGSMR
jgi:hypothetical protein